MVKNTFSEVECRLWTQEELRMERLLNTKSTIVVLINKRSLGTTAKTKNEFDQFVQNQGNDRFRPDRYHLTDNNCNNFTEVCAQFLVGRSIPDC